MKAGCNGYGLGSFTITVRNARFNITPRSVEAGDSITVRGNLCPPGSYVTIKLDGDLIGEDRANDKGDFIGAHEIPSDTGEGAHTVSARCHGRFVGSQLIDVSPSYPAQENLPGRAHPRPGRVVAAGSFEGDAVTRPVGGQGGNGGGEGSAGTQPPASVPPSPPPRRPVCGCRRPSFRVTPPTVLGRDLPEVRLATPEVAVEPPAS